MIPPKCGLHIERGHTLLDLSLLSLVDNKLLQLSLVFVCELGEIKLAGVDLVHGNGT